MLLGMDRAVPVAEKPWQKQDRFADIQSDLDYAGVELNDAALRSSRLKLFAGIEYMRYLDGDKHMVFFANGGLVRNDRDRPPDLDVALMAQRATDARVVLDLVSTGGRGSDVWGRELAERSKIGVAYRLPSMCVNQWWPWKSLETGKTLRTPRTIRFLSGSTFSSTPRRIRHARTSRRMPSR